MRQLSRRRLLGLCVIPTSIVAGGCSSLGTTPNKSTTGDYTTPAGYDIDILSYAQREHSVGITLYDTADELILDKTVTVSAEGDRELNNAIPAKSGQYTATARLTDSADTSFDFTLDPGPDSQFHGLLVIIDTNNQIQIDPVLS